MTDKQTEALNLALEMFEAGHSTVYGTSQAARAITAIREALADSALNRMAENARELGLDYEPPCKTGSQCTSKCQQCEQPTQQQELVGSARCPRCWEPITPPASKPWVGLTSEDKVEILRANGEAAVLILTEAKLREKNA